MPLNSYNKFLRKQIKSTQIIDLCKSSNWAAGTHYNSPWTDSGYPPVGSTPSGSASIPTNATTGALGQLNLSGSGTDQWVWIKNYTLPVGGGQTNGFIILVDRLAHKGGLDGNINTLQTVSTPSLTRFTSGVGVWAAAEIYSSIGSGGSTLSAGYTNSDGTASRTSQPIIFGTSATTAFRTICPISMQSGDKGVKSVENATLATASGTSGNWGITLFKTLGAWPVVNQVPVPLSGDPIQHLGPLCLVPDNSCLQLLHFGSGNASTLLSATMCFFETSGAMFDF